MVLMNLEYVRNTTPPLVALVPSGVRYPIGLEKSDLVHEFKYSSPTAITLILSQDILSRIEIKFQRIYIYL